MAYSVGVVVEAAARVTERGFLGKRIFVHAVEGERGQVVGVDGEWLTVTWSRGTTTDVHITELRSPVKDGHAYAVPGDRS
jgi:hypothetical protein